MQTEAAGYNLSPFQKRTWLFQSDGYILRTQGHIRISGALDISLLEKVWACLVQRHEVCRTNFRVVTAAAFPLQVNTVPHSPLISVLDISAEEISAQAEHINALAEQLYEKNYDLEKEVLLDMLLIRQQENSHLLIVQLPALCCDAVSMVNLLKEMEVLYRNSTDTWEDSETYQFTQFSEWQLMLQEENAADQKILQQNTAFSVCNNTPLSIQHPVRMPGLSGFDRLLIRPDQQLINNIRAYTEKHGCSMQAFFMGIWSVIAAQYLEEEEMVTTGVVFSGRSYEAFSGINGLLQKTIPVSVQISADEELPALFAQVETLLTDISAWEDSFLWENSNYAARTFNYVAIEDANSHQNDDLHFSLVHIENHTEPFAIQLQCIDSQTDFSVCWIFDRALLSKDAIKKLQANFQCCINSVLNDANTTVADILRAMPVETEQLLHTFNDTARVFNTCATVADAFEHQVRKTPHAAAVVEGNEQLTFEELNECANRLAWHLQTIRHIKAGERVAVKMKRSALMIATLLGVIKSGAVYLPVDISVPDERLHYLLADSNSVLLFTEEDIKADIPVLRPVWELLRTGNSCGNPVHVTAPEAPLYLIYTSGSTGMPKGVLVSNMSLMNYISWFIESYGISAQDSTLLLSSVAFDLCYTSLWSSLLGGAALHLLPETILPEPAMINDLLVNNHITYIKLTPSHLSILLADPAFHNKLPDFSLRLIVLGGEKIVPAHLIPFFEAHPDLLFVNHYGPTETTVGTAVCNISKESFAAFAAQPLIGRPIANNRIYILDSEKRLLPVGVKGEICVSGKGVAMGYLNDPERTAQKFIPHPFIPGEKLYCTGDMGRWLNDGVISFTGRKDGQLKIRGYRIEAAEIIARLTTLPGITHAELIVQEDTMVAYYTADTAYKEKTLISHLSAFLPAYMVPAHFIWLQQFPLTPNGKIDKKALAVNVAARQEYTAPTTELELAICKIWTAVTGIEQIGIHDNFFRVGGHSLKAVQVVSRIWQELGYKISLRDFFEAPEIALLADRLATVERTAYEVISPVAPAAEYEVSHAQKRLWMLNQLGTDALAYNMPAAYYLKDAVNAEALNKALQTVIERHEILRTSFRELNGLPVQVVHDAAAYSFRMAYTEATAEEATQLISEAAAIHFDLTHGPLLDARLIRTGESDYIFVFTMHHIISDAWSLEILFREIVTLYNANIKGEHNPLPPLNIQYKDYAAWHNRMLSDNHLKAHRRFWMDQFSGVLPVLNFPADFPRPAIKRYNGDNCSVIIPAALSAGIKQLGVQHDATLFMTLLAAVYALLYRYTGQEDIVIGSPVAGRDHKQLEDQIGLYLNNLSLRARFRSSDSFADLLQQVRQECLLAYEHQLYPFDLLVSDLHIKRDLSRSPLFDVVVVLQNAEDSTAVQTDAMTAVTVNRFDSGFRKSTIDIRIVFTEIADIISCTVDYSTDLYKRSTVEKMLENFLLLLQEITTDETIRIHEISMGDTMKSNDPLMAYYTKFNF